MSFKPVQRKREQKATHFEYTVDMKSLTSPHPPHNPRPQPRTALAIPSVRPGQEPVLRRVPGNRNKDQHSEEEELQISADSFRRLQEIIEAQKGFLKYHEMREILQSGHSSTSEPSHLVKEPKSKSIPTNFKTSKQKKVDPVEDSIDSDDTNSVGVSLNLQSDSDKENSGLEARKAKQYKVREATAKLRKGRSIDQLEREVNDDVQKQKRKANTSNLQQGGEQHAPVKTRRSATTSPIRPALVSTSAQTSLVEEVKLDVVESREDAHQLGAAGVQEKETNPNKGKIELKTKMAEQKTVECDWAYWYVPDTNTLRPARVTIRSRSSGRGSGPVEQGCRKREGRTQDRSTQRVVHQQQEKITSKSIDRLTDEKPWRKGMKKPTEKEDPAIEEDISDKPLPEKPWRSNMRKEPRKPEPPKEDSKPKPEERAWRNNMKKEDTPIEPSVPPPKKRHYDSEEVRTYMKAKRVKEKEEQEECEKQEAQRKEMIKRRLNELDKLQKKITEADLKEYKRMGQAEKHLSEAGQEMLRQKLVELTEQMKAKWSERQRRNEDQEDRSDEIKLESVYQKSDKETVSDRNNVNLVPDFIDSSRKVNNKESLKLNDKSKKNSLSEVVPVIPPQQEAPSFSLSDALMRPAETLSISEVSDATEIKSLSENPRSDKKTHRRSKQWKERLSNGDLPNNVLRVDNICEASRSANATPLTDQIPERDLSEGPESKSQQLRKIVGEVFSRHQSDLDYIRNTIKDIDLPEEPVITPNWTGSSTQFVPKFPIVITTPPSLPDLEPIQPQPLPLPRSSRVVLGGSQDTLESDTPPVWMNVTRDGSETEFNDLPDGLQNNYQKFGSSVNPGTANLQYPSQLTLHQTLPYNPPISQELQLSTRNYMEPPAPTQPVLTSRDKPHTRPPT